MDINNIIEEITHLVKEQCYSEDNIFGKDIWDHHITLVVEQSLILADKYGADKEVVHIAALLHDYASIMDEDLYKEHHIHGATICQTLLTSYGMSQDFIDRVKECIIEHRGSVVHEKTSKESICVASADALAHIYSVPSLMKLVYTRKNLSTTDGSEWVKNKLIRSWSKLCPVSKELAGHKYQSALNILTRPCYVD